MIGDMTIGHALTMQRSSVSVVQLQLHVARHCDAANINCNDTGNQPLITIVISGIPSLDPTSRAQVSTTAKQLRTAY
jgi:hypothetical protein